MTMCTCAASKTSAAKLGKCGVLLLSQLLRAEVVTLHTVVHRRPLSYIR